MDTVVIEHGLFTKSMRMRERAWLVKIVRKRRQIVIFVEATMILCALNQTLP